MPHPLTRVTTNLSILRKPIWGRIMYGNFLPFVSLRTLALGIALLSLARTSAAQFVPASPPIADPADTRFKGVSEDWRVTILNLPVLPLKLMIRKSHIPRIANDIDYFRYLGSKYWCVFIIRGPRCTFESAIGLRRGIHRKIV